MRIQKIKPLATLHTELVYVNGKIQFNDLSIEPDSSIVQVNMPSSIPVAPYDTNDKRAFDMIVKDNDFVDLVHDQGVVARARQNVDHYGTDKVVNSLFDNKHSLQFNFGIDSKIKWAHTFLDGAGVGKTYARMQGDWFDPETWEQRERENTTIPDGASGPSSKTVDTYLYRAGVLGEYQGKVQALTMWNNTAVQYVVGGHALISSSYTQIIEFDHTLTRTRGYNASPSRPLIYVGSVGRLQLFMQCPVQYQVANYYSYSYRGYNNTGDMVPFRSQLYVLDPVTQTLTASPFYYDQGQIGFNHDWDLHSGYYDYNFMFRNCFRDVTVWRSVEETPTGFDLYVPVFRFKEFAENHKVLSLQVFKESYTADTTVHTQTELNLLDAGQPFTAEDDETFLQHHTGKCNEWNIPDRTQNNDSFCWYLTSKLFERDGEKYLSILYIPNAGATKAGNIPLPLYLLQYTFRIDANGTDAHLVGRKRHRSINGDSDDIKGCKGFAFGPNEELYMISDTYVFEYNFDMGSFTFEPVRAIGVQAITLHVDENGDLLIIDKNRRLYRLRNSVNTTVSLQFDQEVAYTGGDQTFSGKLSVYRESGERISAKVKIELFGEAEFPSGSKTIVITTQATGPIDVPVILKGYGEVKAVPTLVE
jgi:hypothetical protein